jgi:hypothetical protein
MNAVRPRLYAGGMDHHLAPPTSMARPLARFVGVALLALAAGFAAWLVLDRNSTDETSAAVAQADGPRISTVDGLSALVALRGSPVYWAGPRAGFVYEVTETKKGYVYVRYLPSGTALGSPRPDFLTVATYPRSDAYGDVEAASHRPGAVAVALPDGALAVYDQGRPTSVYLARRGSTRQVEVYDPSAGEALRLVKSGRVRPVP